MPSHNRYDSSAGRSGRGSIGFVRTGLLILIPILIVALLFGGFYLSYRSAQGDEHDVPVPSAATSDELSLYSQEELLIYVSQARPLDKDYVPELADFDGVRVSVMLVDDLTQLMADASAQGLKLKVSAGYISYSEQARLYDTTLAQMKKNSDYSEVRAQAEAKRISPEAGCSESQTGLLIRFSSDTDNKDFSKTEEFRFLERNAVNFGFILRYPEGKTLETGMNYAPDVFRFVGKEYAMNIRRFDMTLEQYREHLAQQ